MPSSLASQLAQTASFNSAFLANTSRKKPTESYLFSAREAHQHDLEALHALALNGLAVLQSLDPALRNCNVDLFSENTKVTDRTLLSVDANAELDHSIATFLPLLGPHLLDAPTGKVIEWLVRRLRIHEFNVQDVLRLFLPYHESPHFTKMITILHISDQSAFRFLLAYKTTAKSLPRAALVLEMRTNPDLARFVANLLPASLASGGASVHRTLAAFHTGTLLDFVAQSKTLDEGTVAFLLPAFTEPLHYLSGTTEDVKISLAREVVLGNSLLLVALSHKCALAPKAVKAILTTVASCARFATATQLVRIVTSLCASQTELEKLPNGVVKVLLASPDVEMELKSAMVWTGAEHLIGPFVSALVTRLTDDAAYEILTSLITYPQVIGVVVHHAAKLLLLHVVEEGDSNVRARRALSRIQQRHSHALQKAEEEVIQENEARKNDVEQIVLSLSIISSGSENAGDVDLELASVNTDPVVRAAAVQGLYRKLSSTDLQSNEAIILKASVLARMQDHTDAVISALYAEPSQLVPVLLADVETYIATLARILHESRPTPSRGVANLHLTFFAEHVWTPLFIRDSAIANRAFYQLVLPYLLFSKPRQKTADMAWEVIERTEGAGLGAYELLGGCIDAVRWQEGQQPTQKGGDKTLRFPTVQTKINLVVASKIAENILASNSFTQNLDALLGALQASNVYSRNLSYLIVRALLSRIEGGQQLNTGYRVLQAMDLQSLENMGDFMREVDDLYSFLHDDSLGMAVVLKPGSHNTLHRLQTAILVILSNTARPTQDSMNWLDTNVEITPDDTNTRYVHLMRAVYKLGNSSTSLPLLSTHLLRILFINLRDDALAFLAGIWLADGIGGTELQDHLRHAALRHAMAFLEAHCATAHWVDFQTILPALLVAFQNTNQHVRKSAAECLSVLAKLSESKTVSAVYAFDIIYGSGSAQLQYMEWNDFCTYVRELHNSRDHFVHDPGYVRVFHQQHLGVDAKKRAAYRDRILCYILSHVNACGIPVMKLRLLETVTDVSSVVKAHVLAPTIQTLLEDHSFEALEPYAQQIAVMAVSCYDGSVATRLNKQTDPWSLFTQTLRHCFESDKMTTARAAISYRLQHDLFTKLSLEHRAEICHILLNQGTQNVDSTSECKKLLVNVLLSDAVLMINLLTFFQPTLNETNERASKRAKLDVTSTNETNRDRLSSLSILAEVMGSGRVPGSVELISCLLETLKRVVHDTSLIVAGRSYVEQLLMAAIENVSLNVSESTKIAAGAIRLDVLVELIRVSENPQTFHQALLLMATLSRLAPDAVLLNVMPVFTFMGSNVFHRDDTYSFRVVQKTIDNIVPVMVASLKSGNTTPLDLYIKSRDFLRIFTDASNHIPRHRRTNFFSRLIDVLGPDDFLGPVCMLLVDKMANRVVRQNSHDAEISLSLPLATLHHYPADVQLRMFIELLHEAHRLMDPVSVDSAFLNIPSDDDQLAVVSQRRAQALIVFVDCALKKLNTPSAIAQANPFTSELLSLLLSLAVSKGRVPSVDVVADTARVTMGSALNVMTANDFTVGILTMLQSPEIRIQLGALDLLGDRLNSVADHVRRDLTPNIIKIVDIVLTLLSSNTTDAVKSVFRGLNAISVTACPGEENALTKTVPAVLEASLKHATAPEAMTVLLPLTTKLGPRLIPYFRNIVQDCVDVVRKCVTGSWALDDTLVTNALRVLQSLLSSIPTFWGEQEITCVIELYLDSRASLSKLDALESFAKYFTKRAPSKILLPTMCQVWDGLSSTRTEAPRMLGFFDLMKRSLRAAGRPDALEHLRSLTKTFLHGFDTSATIGVIEPKLITAFLELVVKLNDTAFKPLFRKLFDWAFAASADGMDQPRQVVFCHMYLSLLDYFKGLLTPYMSFLLRPFVTTLQGFSATSSNKELWLSIIQVFTKSFVYDEGAFWRDDKLREVISPLIKQVGLSISMSIGDDKTALCECLTALTGIVNNDDMLKSINLDILMNTRSEDSRIRIFSLLCSEAVWQAHGGKFLGFVAETTTFIAECAEDENDSVVREAHKLKDTVESVAGSIDL